MPPQGRYALEDFVKTGQTDFKKEFRNINKAELFRFEKKTYVNDENQVCEDSLLYVGKWHSSITRIDGPTAWTLSNKEGIKYYAGPHGRVLLPVLQRGRMYHDYPFDLLSRSEGLDSSRRGYDRTLEVKEAVIEPVIKFAFLLTGRSKYVDNLTGTDMLSNFRFACMNLHKNTRKTKDAKSSIPELSQPVEIAMVLPERQRNRTRREERACVETQSSTALVSRKRARVGLDDEEHDSLAPLPKKRQVFVNQLTNYEASIREEMVDELRALEVQLDQQKTKTAAARAKRHRDKDARLAVETELGEMKAKVTQQERTMKEIVKKQKSYAEEVRQLKAKAAEDKTKLGEMIKKEMGSRVEVAQLKVKAREHKKTVDLITEKLTVCEKERTHYKALYDTLIEVEDSATARKTRKGQAPKARKALEAQAKTKIKQED